MGKYFKCDQRSGYECDKWQFVHSGRKKQQAVEETTKTVADGLKQNITPGNISGLKSLFTGGGASSITGNPIVQNIEKMVINTLIQKVGLSPNISNSVASSIVSAVAGNLSNKVQDPNEKGFDLQSLIGAFTGGGNKTTTSQNTASAASTNHTGDILGTLGNLFKG